MTLAEALDARGSRRRCIGALGLTDVELDAIRERLGRDAQRSRAGHVQRHVERALLVQELEAAAAHAADRRQDVLAGPGENAGVVSIGDGLAVAFKLESHNHPSAVEPYQGAATGVGGILRDIFAMGARPVALLDALKFGWPDDGARAGSSTASCAASAATATASAYRPLAAS